MTRWWLCILGALALTPAYGCKPFDPSLLPPPSTNCPNGSNVPPDAPSTADGTDQPEMVFAFKDVKLSSATAGFNLDGLCTGSSGPWGCLPPTELPVYEDGGVPTVPQDSSKGTDSQFAAKLYTLLGTLGISDLEGTAGTSEAQGIGTPIVLIDNYNGTANDPKVRVVIGVSVFGAEGTGGVGGTPPDVCPPTSPTDVAHYADPSTGCSPPGTQVVPPLSTTTSAWTNGNLWFWVRDDGFTGGMLTQPMVFDDNAYVNNYQLVVHMPEPSTFSLVAGSLSVEVTLTDGVAMGTLNSNLLGSSPNGVTIAGRWSKTDMLAAVGSVGATGICPGSFPYNTLSSTLDANADVLATKGGEGPDVACNAISIGITMTAYRANFGGLASAAPIASKCP